MIAFALIALAFLAGGWLFRRRPAKPAPGPLYVARMDREQPKTMERVVCPFCRKWVRSQIVYDRVMRTYCPDCGTADRPLGSETIETVPNLAHRKEPRA